MSKRGKYKITISEGKGKEEKGEHPRIFYKKIALLVNGLWNEITNNIVKSCSGKSRNTCLDCVAVAFCTNQCSRYLDCYQVGNAAHLTWLCSAATDQEKDLLLLGNTQWTGRIAEVRKPVSDCFQYKGFSPLIVDTKWHQCSRDLPALSGQKWMKDQVGKKHLTDLM